MEVKEFLRKMVTRNGGISSKRVCGVIGWAVCLFVLVYATLSSLTVPSFADTVLIASAALLGVESVTNVWRKNDD